MPELRPIQCNCSHRHGVVVRNMCGHEVACPEYFAWASRIVFKQEHFHSSQVSSECSGCLPAWQGPFKAMVASLNRFHVSRDCDDLMHFEIAAEKPQFDQVVIAYCCESCGAHGAEGVDGAFREKVRQVRAAEAQL